MIISLHVNSFLEVPSYVHICAVVEKLLRQITRNEVGCKLDLFVYDR